MSEMTGLFRYRVTDQVQLDATHHERNAKQSRHCPRPWVRLGRSQKFSQEPADFAENRDCQKDNARKDENVRRRSVNKVFHICFSISLPWVGTGTYSIAEFAATCGHGARQPIAIQEATGCRS